MITLRNVTLRRGPNVLLENVNWVIYHQQRIGIIGANGSGKTSFFSLLLNQLQPDVGDIEFPKALKIAYVAQETPGLTLSALDFVLDGDEELRHLEYQLLAAENSDDGEKIAEIHSKLHIIDAYTAPSRAAQLLAGLGFSEAEQKKQVSEFSGGWRVRLGLAKALMSPSDILLLDEPTNHLDLDTVIWLEQWLMKYQGTLLLISHDREFLDTTVSHIAHIDHQQLKLYTGNYSTFEKIRAEQLLLQQALYEKQQKQIAHMQSFINRFGAKATKAKQAQSRVKAIARLELVCAVQADSEFTFKFRQPTSIPYPLVTLEHVQVAYPSDKGLHIVLDNISLSITPSDRIGILGPNGAGKSSFIKTLAGELKPTSGIYTGSAGLKIGYFAQHQVDYLNLEGTPLEHLKELSPNTSELELRKFLGSFGFSGDRVHETMKNFSGGEKSRLALSLIVWQKPNLLLLDEPTNHLDLEMRNALSIALQEYNGALLVVSHDRFLLRSTVDQFYLVAEGKLQKFDGDLQDYQRWLFEYRKKLAAQNQQSSKKTQHVQSQETLRVVLEKIKKIEAKLLKVENNINQLEIKLSDNSIYESSKHADLKIILSQQVDLKKQQAELEHEWLKLCEVRDNNF